MTAARKLQGNGTHAGRISVSPKHFLLVLGVRALIIFNHRKERKEKKTVKLENTSSKLTRATRVTIAGITHDAVLDKNKLTI